MASFGYGPWFVALIEDCSHPGASEIFIHTYPENVVSVKNLQQQHGKGRCWLIHFYVGPFSHMQQCLSYYNQWIKSKQLKTRIEQGHKLFNEQKGKQNLYMYRVYPAAAAAQQQQQQQLQKENAAAAYITIQEIKNIANKRN